MARRIILALVLTALAAPFGARGAESTVAEGSPAPAWSGVRVVGLESEPARTVEAQEMVARFVEVGLKLPTVTIEFHESAAPCNGHDGFIRYTQPAPIISICSDRPYVLPHELAHAWIDANLTDAGKADYVAQWDLASWDGANDDWNDRGTEHAAFVIQQNVTATPPRMTRTWRERAEAFEMLTGIESPLSGRSQA